jgi:hypothetical protein
VEEGLQHEEFAQSLSPHEDHYLQVCRLRVPDAAARAEFSEDARWQLDLRIRRKAARVYRTLDAATGGGKRHRRLAGPAR